MKDSRGASITNDGYRKSTDELQSPPLSVAAGPVRSDGKGAGGGTEHLSAGASMLAK